MSKNQIQNPKPEIVKLTMGIAAAAAFICLPRQHVNNIHISSSSHACDMQLRAYIRNGTLLLRRRRK
jgi:hypothetical protein